MARVVLDHVSKSFDRTDVIRDLSLSVSDREFVVLVGPSGCGKSTVLRMIAGLEGVTDGTVTLGDRVVNDVPPKDRDIAMVFQNYALYPHMNVYDNMAFGLKMRKVPKADIDRRVRQAAGILDLADLLSRKPRQLSGGQRQRVALGRAIVRDPKVFLMDEPLSNLDAKLRIQMRTEITRLHRRLNVTTLYVTHDQVEAMTMGDRIVILHQGVLQQVDSPETIYNRPQNLFVAGFIGQMNLLEGHLQEGQVVLDGGARLPLPEPWGSVLAGRRERFWLGLRPEHFCLPLSGPGLPVLTVKPELVEMLGNEKLVHFPVGAASVTARLPADSDVSVGKMLSLAVDLAPASLFDPGTGMRIG